jgi:hypothetical protein
MQAPLAMADSSSFMPAWTCSIGDVSSETIE